MATEQCPLNNAAVSAVYLVNQQKALLFFTNGLVLQNQFGTECQGRNSNQISFGEFYSQIPQRLLLRWEIRQFGQNMINFQKVCRELQVVAFHLVSQYFTMSNLRKRTLPDQVLPTNRSHITSTKQPRLRSEMLDLQMPESIFQETQKLIKSQIPSNQTLYERKHKKVKSFQLDEIDKILCQNRLTLDFEEHARNTELPEISTFKKTQKLLVSPPIFEQFREANKVDGCFSSALSEAEQEFNAKKMKINISKSSQIIVRHNILLHGRAQPQSNSENEIHSILSKSRKNGFSLGVGSKEQLRKNMKSLRKISYALGLKGLDKIDKWKLKDFYDPILQQLESDESNLKKLRERESILHKLKRIDAECSEMERNTQIAANIEVFAKYSKNMSDKLVKKQRKIDKIYFYSY